MFSIKSVPIILVCFNTLNISLCLTATSCFLHKESRKGNVLSYYKVKASEELKIYTMYLCACSFTLKYTKNRPVSLLFSA